MVVADKKTILIIDDDRAQRWLFVHTLRRADYAVLAVSNGEEGLSVALTKHPDLVILDVVMPKIDGLEVLQRLRADSWGKGVPVIVLTNLNTAALPFGNKGGQTVYLEKGSWSLENMIKTVEEMLD